MATKAKPLTAEYDQDTKNGKRRFKIGERGDAVTGAIYLDKDDPRYEAETLELTLKAVESE